jgi:hypothetical protein
MATNLRALKSAEAPRTERHIGYMQDDQGHQSSMRLMCMMALLSAIVFGALSILAAMGLIGASNAGADAITITFGFLVAAFAPKAIQKFAEQKSGVKPAE